MIARERDGKEFGVIVLAEGLEQTLRDFVAATRRPGPLVVPELRDLEEAAAPGAEEGSGAVDDAGSTGEP